ncbi:hypothetical protein MPTK1_1g00230 [Marchantia polymorpha subsp. ruderalis]|uniref:DEX1 C-terminal domain-containing protein n=2 Tax=Marchantia polymorpha TaxID=3197 RepID=A0AAF6AJW3_MARPO|nr:hypothetical protein MARPO_0103s0063 [Marchantia polymorpha]BBM96733.1 hypothetical protein Mp_1g00230 [Marchantia polymorpha subsp. ruderalis]|eukprot:PTQ32095.1 hypothetical protein MARPO_0103s0063 [Marchantia polymorpha]
MGRFRKEEDDSVMWRKMRVSASFFLLCFVVLFCERSEAQLSKPVAHDDNMKEAAEGNKFLTREASDDSLPVPHLDEEALANTQCPQHVELRWQTEVSSSIYATPLISDINGDGKLEIVVPTFVHYLEVLDGADGEKLSGWPAFHQSTVHASALAYDIDKDGNKEIALATFNGEVLFFRFGGYMLTEKLVVPRRKVRKDWYVGLDPDHVDRSHPDVHGDEYLNHHDLSLNGSEVHVSHGGKLVDETDEDHHDMMNGAGDHVDDKTTGTKGSDSSLNTTVNGADALNHVENITGDTKGSDSPLDTTNHTTSGTEHDTTKLKVDSTVSQDGLSTGGIDLLAAKAGAEKQEPKANTRRRLQQETKDDSEKDDVENKTNQDDVATAEEDQDAMEEEAKASFDVFREEDENGEDGLTEEYDYDYDDYVNEGMWDNNEWDEGAHEKIEDFVQVDAHILCTPVIADIDNDGVDEMVVAASYFYDREYYEMPEHAKELGDLDLGKYVAGAIVVFNLETKQVKWDTYLDLSVDSTTYRAYIYSAPSVVDLDGDGQLEIIVGTSMGFVYVLNANGTSRKGFPLQMGEIQGQVVAADVNDDGKIEIITADAKGTVAVWDGDGKELWEVHLKSLISQGPTVGDVDGDGHTDIVVPTTSGSIYVLKGQDGSHVGPYPFRTHGRVMSPALLVDLSKRGAERKGLTIAIGSFDGYFYLIDGPTGCAEAIDIGETTYSMVLADNVDGGDDLDLIVTTMNGNVYCFQTPAPHHPLKAWPSQTQGRNVLASRHQREGIFVVPRSRAFRDEAGDSFHVAYEIVDKYRPNGAVQGAYQVKVTLMTPGNYRGEKRITYNYTHDNPGLYIATLPCVATRTGGTVLVEMLDKNSLYFQDEFALTFHMHYYRLLKWLLTLPLLGMTGMFLVFRPQEGAPLPSFTRERHQL